MMKSTMQTGAPLVEIQNVHQSFRIGFWMQRKQVLEDIHLTIPEGSIFGFLGANGAGKTTLIHLIIGLRNPTQGSVKVFGKNATHPEAKLHLGYLPERPYFYDHLTGEQLLYYFGFLSGMKRSAIKNRITSVLEAVGMLEARHLELRRYSKGMLQRIGIAQALIHDPQFLVLDEPMSGLDPIGRKEIRELILKLASEGRTIFFSTHIVPDVEAICNRVALIKKGKIVKIGSMEELLYSGQIQTEVNWSGVKPEILLQQSGFQFQKEIAGGYRGIISTQEAVNQILGMLIGAGGKIHSVSPIRHSLEDLFLGS